jgi:hypothetical protein
MYIFELYNAEKQQLVENLDRFEGLKHTVKRKNK